MSDHTRPLVSVVVPFYNTAEFLEECVVSVLDQEYQELELILSDNRSDDGSSRIARRLAESDSRARYVRHDEFLAQVPNYNRALAEISPRSRYTKIVQADDWIYPECLRRMVEVAERHPEVGLVSSLCLKGSRVKNSGLPPDREVFGGREVCRRQLLEGAFYLGSPTSVLYRSEIVRRRRPFFTPGRLHEDTEAGYEILREWDLGFVHQVLSYLRVREGSIQATRAELDPHLLDKLVVIHRYGSDFLTVGELEATRAKYSGRYYGFLGKALLRRRKREFWEYHRRGLATIGERIRWSRVVLGSLRAVAAAVLNPLDTLSRLGRRLVASSREPAPEEPRAAGEVFERRMARSQVGPGATEPRMDETSG